MHKKGSLPIEVIAVTILILIVLVVLSIVFREQLGQLFASFSKLITGTTESVNTINISQLQ